METHPTAPEPLRQAALLLLVLASLAGAQDVKRTYAMLHGDRVVGWHIETETPVTEDGRPAIRFDVRSLAKLEILGASMDQKVEQTWILDPETRATRRLVSRMEVGERVIEARGVLGPEGFEVTSSETRQPLRLDPAEVVISPELRWLGARGPKEAGKATEVSCLMPEIGAVQPTQVTLLQAEPVTIKVLDKPVKAHPYRLETPALGLSMTVHVAPGTCEVLRYDLASVGLVIERAPPALIERIERVDLTNTILVRTDADIGDFQALTRLEVRAEIHATRNVTAEMLNRPGQRFEGTVEEGVIRGVFEISPRRLAREGAPPYPLPEGSIPEKLRVHLEPGPEIECDDPAIAAKAAELAAGVTSTYDLLQHFTDWIHANIPYRIPGGGSARRTLELRAGECGGQSRLLAAMLRSSGVPARTVMGGMYTPLYGGSFAQHMWTEVWLGPDLGWQPVDATAGEATYIDAGHICLTEGLTSFRPIAIEILAHEPKPAEAPAGSKRRRTDEFPFPAGEALTYRYELKGKELGKERITYQGRDDERGGHVFQTELDLTKASYRETATTVVRDDGGLLAFQVECRRGERKETISVAIQDGRASVNVRSPDGERDDSATFEPSTFPLHNNCMVHFAIPVSRFWPLRPGEEVELRMFHHAILSSFSAKLRAGEVVEIEWPRASGRKVRVTPVDFLIPGLKLRLHVDERGRMLRFHQEQGDVLIELEGP